MSISSAKWNIESVAFFGGLTAILFEWLAVLFFYFTSPSEFIHAYALSYYATVPETKLIFATCLSFAAFSFWIFVKWHLAKYYTTPVNVFTFSMIAYLAIALVPFDPNHSVNNVLHSSFAFFFTVSFMIGMYLMAKYNSDRELKTFSFPIIVVSSMLFVTMSMLQSLVGFLYFEVAIGICCHVWIVGVTYQSYKKLNLQ